jgi:hypothetical protein
MVKGLSRNKAATTYPDHFLSARGDLNNLEVLASPDSAILYSALALRRSIRMYRAYVKIG